MNAAKPHSDPAIDSRPLIEEADIGSGEKPPGQAETEEMIRQIPPLPPTGPAPAGTEGAHTGGAANP